MRAFNTVLALVLIAVCGTAAHADSVPPVTVAQKKQFVRTVLQSYPKQVTGGNVRLPAPRSGCTIIDPSQSSQMNCLSEEWRSTFTEDLKVTQKAVIQGAREKICQEIQKDLPEAPCDRLFTVEIASAAVGYNSTYYVWKSYFTLQLSLHPQFEETLILEFDPTERSVAYNAKVTYYALRELLMIPRQRKAIEGFWNAAAAFAQSLKAEEEKQQRGERFKAVTHRDFTAQASLLLAYYRYLQEDLEELAQLASDSKGRDPGNRHVVEAIKGALANLVDAYGLETDAVAKQAADYGRVFVDLMNNFSATLTQNEKQSFVRPLMLQVGSRIIPAAEAYGDVGAREAILEFRTLWENAAFQQFLREKLSASDDRSNSLLLNLSNLAYKIGLSVNIEIRAFDAKDIARIKSETKPRP